MAVRKVLMNFVFPLTKFANTNFKMKEIPAEVHFKIDTFTITVISECL